MRKQLCETLVERSSDTRMVFLTGDLGFMALEPLQKAMGNRFINGGVAEQNLISVAAALAREGFDAWVYSIAPFLYARSFEQIRNDIAFHGLPVKLVGNGGGYGYGVMGPTHHALEDYGLLLTLPDMSVYIPVFDEDVAAVVAAAGKERRPGYLRMGRGEPPQGYDVPPYDAWRQLVHGGGPAVVAVGPLAGTYIAACQAQAENCRPNLWALAELPIERNPIPLALLDQIRARDALVLAEEHVRQGSAAGDLMLSLSSLGRSPGRFHHLFATAHNFGRYGSQSYLRDKSGLDASTLISVLDNLR
jgi:transketolase